MTMAVAKDPDKWERMPDEGSKPWAAFNVYLQLGPDRTIDQAWRIITGGRQESDRRASGRYSIWAARFTWLARALAWDEYLAAQARKALIQSAEENARIRVRNLTSLSNQAMMIVQRADLKSLSNNDARKLLPQAIRALEMTAESLREEFGVGTRPTTNRELSVHMNAESGIGSDEELDNAQLLKRIIADSLGLSPDTDLDRYRVNGQGTLTRLSDGSGG
jgi:hypothetical protein